VVRSDHWAVKEVRLEIRIESPHDPAPRHKDLFKDTESNKNRYPGYKIEGIYVNGARGEAGFMLRGHRLVQRVAGNSCEVDSRATSGEPWSRCCPPTPDRETDGRQAAKPPSPGGAGRLVTEFQRCPARGRFHAAQRVVSPHDRDRFALQIGLPSLVPQVGQHDQPWRFHVQRDRNPRGNLGDDCG